MPRRLRPPDPPLADDLIRLEPIAQSDHDHLVALAGDEGVAAFTLVPTEAGTDFISSWIARYERGWEDGSCAGFVARDRHDGTFVAFASIVQLDLEARQGEIGYAVAPAARGRGIAGRAVQLLTSWGFGELALIRLQLDIDVVNAASARVAEKAGYRLEGVRRSVHFKEGRRTDVGIWSRLRDDPAVT